MKNESATFKIEEYKRLLNHFGADYIFNVIFVNHAEEMQKKSMHDRVNELPKTYVYLIRHGDTDYYKIGVSEKPKKRACDLSVGSPLTNSVIATSLKLRKTSAYNLESKLHSLYSHRKANGEWFDFSFFDVEQVIRELNNPSAIRNEALMLNEIVFGVREGKVRDTATEAQLDKISELEQHNATMIMLNMDYQERKSKLKQIFDHNKLVESN
jgi:hypothetical protein